MDLSIVIVSYNTRDMVEACLRALPDACRGLQAEVLLVDNASSDGTAAMVEERFPAVRVIANSDNAGFARANNQALKLATGRNVLLLNPDTEALPGSLTVLSAYLDRYPDVGAVGPRLLNSNGSIQQNGRPFPTPWRELLGHSGLRFLSPRQFDRKHEYGRSDFDLEWETDQVSGACIMVPHRVMDKVGTLDEAFFMFYEEVEWCWRIKRAGWRVVYVPDACVVHHWMGSVRQQSRRMTRMLYRSGITYYRKTSGPLAVATMALAAALGTLRNEVIHLGVAVKRTLRRARGRAAG